MPVAHAEPRGSWIQCLSREGACAGVVEGLLDHVEKIKALASMLGACLFSAPLSGAHLDSFGAEGRGNAVGGGEGVARPSGRVARIQHLEDVLQGEEPPEGVVGQRRLQGRTQGGLRGIMGVHKDFLADRVSYGDTKQFSLR